MRKIGILTYHRSINYGAYLQAYSLYMTLKNKFGKKYKIEIIDYESKKAHDVYVNQYMDSNFTLYVKFKRVLKKLNRTTVYIQSDSLDRVFEFIKKRNYYCVVAGSDEIWKVNGMRGFPNAYWLNGDIGRAIKVSYAASSRNSIESLTKGQKDYIREALGKFDYIGVRDFSTQQMISDITEQTINVNCDPVFLHDFGTDSNYKKKLYKKYAINEDRKIMVVMIPDNRLIQLLKRYMSDFVIISVYDYNSFADINLTTIDPFEWIKVISSADFMITNRFHGVSFAMKYNVPFLALDNYDEKDTSKIFDLLHRCNLENRYYEFQGYQSDESRRAVIKLVNLLLLERMDYSEMVSRLIKDSDSFFDFLGEI